MKKSLLIIVSLILYTLSAFSQNKENICCPKALNLIDKYKGNKNFIIIDFRPEELFVKSHLDGAIFHDIFSGDIDNWIKKLDKSKIYLIYCSKGYRSRLALEKMKKYKFLKIYHLNEGINKWKELKYKYCKDTVK